MFHAYSATPTRYVNGTRETVAKLSSKRFYDLSCLIHESFFPRRVDRWKKRRARISKDFSLNVPSKHVNFSSCFTRVLGIKYSFFLLSTIIKSILC